MTNVSSGLALRDLVVANLPCNLALPVLVSVLDADLPRLAAINRIMITMSANDAAGAVAEMNDTMRQLGLRRSGEDRFWFGFDSHPLGGYCRRPGTLSIFARSADGSIYVLSPGARSFGSGAIENVGACVKADSSCKQSLTSLDAPQSLEQIRAVLVQRLNQIDWTQVLGD